jgi:branched-chain amino acid transport system ATP-binding protein
MTPALVIRDLRATYRSGGQVLHGVDLEVAEGGVTALLGANGAGKTTALRAVTGLVPRTGTIRFAGHDLVPLATDRIARLGVAHVPEGRGTLTRLSTLDNLLAGAALRRDRRLVAADLERCLALFPALTVRRSQAAGSLSGGEQQMLAIARALMGRPRLLLLDEPSLGLAPVVTRDLFAAIAQLRVEWGLAMLLVEQNAVLALAIADTALVLESGRVALRGTARELAARDEVRRAYLGS